MTTERKPTVLHVDLDAFYVSMELLRRPDLRGLPVVVGGEGSRGVVATASYEARKYGVRSAMPGSRARQLCPSVVFLPPDWSLYGPASKTFHAILRDYTPAVEPAGSDEAYLDVAGCERLFGEAPAIAQTIRSRVRAEIGIAASIGVSTNKLVSKVASDAAKPDGLLVVPAGGEAAFLAPRPLRDLPMIGPKTAEALTKLGVHTIGELAATPAALLAGRFGPHGHDLRRRANGEFDGVVAAGRGEAKSVSREVTFGEDVADLAKLRAVVRGQAERIAADLAQQGRSARTVSLKLRFPPFETLTRATTLSAPIDLADEIYAQGTELFTRAWGENGRRPVRLIGIGVSALTERVRQLQLGETLDASNLADTVAGLRERFGDDIVLRAAELHRPRRDGP
ncbi:MAG: DNA polymerase IV [Dehalococcoidia bacterium]